MYDKDAFARLAFARLMAMIAHEAEAKKMGGYVAQTTPDNSHPYVISYPNSEHAFVARVWAVPVSGPKGAPSVLGTIIEEAEAEPPEWVMRALQRWCTQRKEKYSETWEITAEPIERAIFSITNEPLCGAPLIVGTLLPEDISPEDADSWDAIALDLV